ncbi:hypothetical protein FNV43_RR01397 [Rhamnella rubrinervis]|uniref:SREBP regulating gene protein n=1 Tax=Rhamnella rubrinervis TaxID=2594499 RepID=A0A8K0MSX6_9ROSA|nr:hypothetical protein FNV43_RR01397 [Rhamnella rubrinervis]
MANLIMHPKFHFLIDRKDTGFLEKRFCRNTVQGRYFLSDDNGKKSFIFNFLKDADMRVCDALSVDPVSRCCPEKGDKFSCHGCNLLSQCCNSSQYCVSCCLNPLKMLKQHILKMKIAKPATAGTYANVFDFCAGRCVIILRVWFMKMHILVNSTTAILCRQILQVTYLEGRLNGINILVGRQGKSCDSVCKSNGQSCVPNFQF